VPAVEVEGIRGGAQTHILVATIKAKKS
jgi:hypothetical protein